jgi:hypothetical protein
MSSRKRGTSRRAQGQSLPVSGRPAVALLMSQAHRTSTGACPCAYELSQAINPTDAGEPKPGKILLRSF